MVQIVARNYQIFLSTRKLLLIAIFCAENSKIYQEFSCILKTQRKQSALANFKN